MNNDCNNSRKTTLSHTFDYGKEVDTSITLSRSVSSSIVSENTFANTKAITFCYLHLHSLKHGYMWFPTVLLVFLFSSNL